MKTKTRERYGFVSILISMAFAAFWYGIDNSNFILVACGCSSVLLAIYFLLLTKKLDKEE